MVTRLGSSSFVNVAADGSDNTLLTITAKTAGKIGNYRYYVDNTSGTFTTADYYMTGGLDFTTWSTSMGINTGPYTGTGTSNGDTTNNPIPNANAIAKLEFTSGEEDIEVDITDFVNNILWDGAALRTLAAAEALHNGFLLKVRDESMSTSTYTKKFFARTSQYFYKRPCVEARWDGSFKDARVNFKAESTLLGNADNKHTIYLYNSHKGARTNFALPVNNEVYVVFYHDSDYSDNSNITIKDPNSIPAYGTVSSKNISASQVDTGVYAAEVVIGITGSISTIYDKWYIAEDDTAGNIASATVVHTGSFSITPTATTISTKKQRYIFDITNLKNSYTRSEKPRFRVYSRLKDWSPTIYTKAKNSLENYIIEKVYYKVFRVVGV